MTSRSKAEHIFKLASFLMLFAVGAHGGTVERVFFTGCREVPCDVLSGGSLLAEGMVLSGDVLGNEIARIDSIYFSKGFLETEVEVDTTSGKNGITVHFVLHEGTRAKIGKIGISA